VIRIGNAPVSYGAFEVTVGHDPDVPTAVDVLDAVESAGYDGVDLGPLGYLGLGESLAERLTARGLFLTGGYVEIEIGGAGSAEGMAELDKICDQFDVVAGDVDAVFRPRPTVALISTNPPLVLDDGWDSVAQTIEQIDETCAQRGYEACLHNEVGTVLATEESLRRVLETTSASLCLDTGHLVAAGGDPRAMLGDWKDRVSHIHLKDARVSPPSFYDDAMGLWENDVFCPLGKGTGHVDDVLNLLRQGGYSGWIVVEQDVLPRGPASYERARLDQIANRQYLRERNW